MKHYLSILLFVFFGASCFASKPLKITSATKQGFVSGHPSGGIGYNYKITAKVLKSAVSIQKVLINGKPYEFDLICEKLPLLKGSYITLKVIRKISAEEPDFTGEKIEIEVSVDGKLVVIPVKKYKVLETFKGI